MLVDFAVENFRSIREAVTLSLVEVAPRKARQEGAQRKRALPTDEQISPALAVPGWDIKLLRAAGIFGANASGKSNVIRALATLGRVIQFGGEAQLDAFRTPFALVTGEGPTRMRLRTMSGGLLYDYEIAMDDLGIVEERLQKRAPRGRAQPLFQRIRDATGELAATTAASLQSLRGLARDIGSRTPFLHLLIWKLRTPELEDLRKDWKNMRVAHGAGGAAWDRFTSQRACADPEKLKAILALLRSFDTGLAQIAVIEVEDGPQTSYRVDASRQFSDGVETQWPLKEESEGTQTLYAISGPLLSAIDDGSPLCLDEFGAHLHPHIARRIVELFQNPETNPKGAQLIFNSQDATLLANHLLRRDQVWYTQKRPDGSTELYPLSDFKPRNDLAIGVAYLDGRFGAVPFLASEGGLQ